MHGAGVKGWEMMLSRNRELCTTVKKQRHIFAGLAWSVKPTILDFLYVISVCRIGMNVVFLFVFVCSTKDVSYEANQTGFLSRTKLSCCF